MSEAPKVYINSILNDIRRKFNSPEFESGAITTILGNADIDLREAKMKTDEACLTISNILGSVYIYPAENWEVNLEITEIAGKVRDRRKKNTGGKSPRKILRICGVTFLGDVNIR